MQVTALKSSALRPAAGAAPSRRHGAQPRRAQLLVPRFKWPGSEDAPKPVPENEPLLAPEDLPKPVREEKGKDAGLTGAADQYGTPVLNYDETAGKGFFQSKPQPKKQQAPVPDNEVLLSPGDLPKPQRPQGAQGLQGASNSYGMPVTDYPSKGNPTSSQPMTTGTAGAQYSSSNASGNSSWGASDPYASSSEDVYQDFAARIQAAWDNTENKPQLALYSGVAILALWLSNRLVDAVDRVPIVPGALKLVGLVYTANFFYKYVLFAKGRERLRRDIDDIIGNIESRRDELAAAAGDSLSDEQAKAQRRAAAGPSELRRQAAEAASSTGTNGALEAAVKADVGIPTQTQPTQPSKVPASSSALGGIAQSKAMGEGAGAADVE